MSLPKNGRPRAILACGGWAHPADEIQPPLVELLATRGFAVVVVDDVEDLTAALGAGCELLVVAACWFTMTQDRYTAAQRNEWGVPVDVERQRVLGELIDSGTPVFALHTAVICFDTWPGWRERLGGGWNWQRSNHPPPVHLKVNGCDRQESGIQIEPFTVVDEEYRNLDVAPGSEVVARSGSEHPLMWLNQRAGRRVAVDVLGHDRRSLDIVGHRAAIEVLLDWLLAGEPVAGSNNERTADA